jgi:hypothetical protein
MNPGHLRQTVGQVASVASYLTNTIKIRASTTRLRARLRVRARKNVNLWMSGNPALRLMRVMGFLRTHRRDEWRSVFFRKRENLTYMHPGQVRQTVDQVASAASYLTNTIKIRAWKNRLRARLRLRARKKRKSMSPGHLRQTVGQVVSVASYLTNTCTVIVPLSPVAIPQWA